MEEILTFCSRYLDNIETRWNRCRRVDDGPSDIQSQSRIAELFPDIGKPVGGSSLFTLTAREKLQAHRHVLTNCPIVDYYLKQYRTIIRRQLRTKNASEIDKKVHREFVCWFANRIGNNLGHLRIEDKDVLISLAQGPFDQARRFSAYNVNGYKFRTLTRDKSLKTQNSGVFGMFGTRSYSSTSDDQMRFGGVPYYGRLVDIIELYYRGFTVVMFKCEWANTTNPRGMKMDKLGFTSINFARLIHSGEHEDDEPYIKASEAQMVFYVEDEKEQGWSIPVHLRPRDIYVMGEDEDEIMASNETYPSQNLEQLFLDDSTHIPLARAVLDDDLENIDDDNNNCN